MFLWPFVMQVVLKAETCNSTAFVSTYNHPCVLQCAGAGTGASFAGKLLKVPRPIVETSWPGRVRPGPCLQGLPVLAPL